MYGTARVRENVTSVRVYDPNYPREDGAAIRCELLEGGARVRCERLLPSGETVRGFFIVPYTHRTPPCLP